MPAIDPPTQLTDDQFDAALAVTNRAFHDDPVWAWVLPDEDERRRLLTHLMAPGIRFAHLFGHVETTPDVAGAACWLLPGEGDFTPERMAAAGMDRIAELVGADPFARFMQIIAAWNVLHSQITQPHDYLMILGVDPPHQGAGLGTHLLRPTLARADEDGLPCYLETATEPNVRFYQRRGFEVVVEDRVPNGPRYWTMLRRPGAAHTSPRAL